MAAPTIFALVSLLAPHVAVGLHTFSAGIAPTLDEVAPLVTAEARLPRTRPTVLELPDWAEDLDGTIWRLPSGGWRFHFKVENDGLRMAVGLPSEDRRGETMGQYFQLHPVPAAAPSEDGEVAFRDGHTGDLKVRGIDGKWVPPFELRPAVLRLWHHGGRLFISLAWLPGGYHKAQTTEGQLHIVGET